MLGEEELELVLHQLRRLAVNLNEQVGVADTPVLVAVCQIGHSVLLFNG